MSKGFTQPDKASANTFEGRYLVVSGDSHVGPSARQLRRFCPAGQLAEFDDDAAASAAHIKTIEANQTQDGVLSSVKRNTATPASRKYDDPHYRDALRERADSAAATAGLQDPHARLTDMNAQGVAADVIFAGGQNDESLPFDRSLDLEFRKLGAGIFNSWLAEFCSTDPTRLRGVAQIVLDSVDSAIRQLKTIRKLGLRIINFPAPRPDIVPYTERVYEPFWAVCEELGMVLNTHGAGGERGYWSGQGARSCDRVEGQFMSRRALWGLIFGGVFERHPNLKLVLTEQGTSWVATTLQYLDEIWNDDATWTAGYTEVLPLSPSEYWQSNVYLASSFMSRDEAEARYAIGVERIIYGTDYPHVESVYPVTSLALRQAFNGLSPTEVAHILGLNAVQCFDLNLDELIPIASRIGPTVEDVSIPPTGEDLELIPPMCQAFRSHKPVRHRDRMEG